MEFEDKMITCVDCELQFVHSAADQARYAERGLEHEPKRCAACRAKRRNRQRGSSGGAGGAGGAVGGGPRGPRGAHRSDRSARPSFPAVCHACGKETTVPFQPTEGRPVYCRECYKDGNVDKGG